MPDSVGSGKRVYTAPFSHSSGITGNVTFAWYMLSASIMRIARLHMCARFSLNSCGFSLGDRQLTKLDALEIWQLRDVICISPPYLS